jgi:hypothetical protein
VTLLSVMEPNAVFLQRGIGGFRVITSKRGTTVHCLEEKMVRAKQAANVKVDWIEIHKGDCVTGVSEQQRAMLRDRLWAMLNLDQMDGRRQRVVESLARKFQRSGRDKNYPLKENLTPEEQEVKSELCDSTLYNLLLAILDLERLPSQQRVHIETFYIARFPITKGQATVFYASSFARHFRLHQLRTMRQEDLVNMPEDMCWLAADALAHWLGGRLPTVYEWEKTARGTDGRLYPWGDEWDATQGNFGLGVSPRPNRPRERNNPRTVVTAYPGGTSPYGVWDMVGNGSEWTMTLIPPGSPNTHVPQLKGFGYDGPDPEWYWSLPARTENGPLEVDVVGTYRKSIVLRPVLDSWTRQVWSGFSIEADSVKTE